MTGSRILPCIDNSNNLGTKAAIPRVDTGPYGVETPTPTAGPLPIGWTTWSQGHPGKIPPHDRFRNHSTRLYPQHTPIRFPGSIPPRTMGKHQPHGRIA